MSPELEADIRALDALDADIARGIQSLDPILPTVYLDALPSRSTVAWGDGQISHGWQTGNKFPGGFGETQLLTADYWTLRARSVQLFETNLYARGLIRRLVTNEINTVLHLEATPDESTLGYPEEGLADWAENVENRFHLWEKRPQLCDSQELRSFGALQAQGRMEALIAGDVLVLLRQDRVTGLPKVQLVSASSVQTPLGTQARSGNQILHGVEVDAMRRQVAYWVRQKDGTSKRVPAVGEKSGRRIAWLVYGTDRRLEDVRGKPILSLVLQSLREIDRYRDSTQRKAVIASMLAMFVKRDGTTPGSRPLAAGAVRQQALQETDGAGNTRTFQAVEHIPGTVLDQLEPGEEPHVFSSSGATEAFGVFEEAVLASIAWANETPPEILLLAFSNNYSASQAAINEFKIYLNKIRTNFGESFCDPIYSEWLIAEALAGRIDAPGLIAAWRDRTQWAEFSAWICADWAGHIKPSTDIFKQARGYKLLIEEGLITRDRAARELTGTKFSQNAKKLRRENEALAAARTLLQAMLEPPPSVSPGTDQDEDEDEDNEDEDDTKSAAVLPLRRNP